MVYYVNINVQQSYKIKMYHLIGKAVVVGAAV